MSVTPIIPIPIDREDLNEIIDEIKDIVEGYIDDYGPSAIAVVASIGAMFILMFIIIIVLLIISCITLRRLSRVEKKLSRRKSLDLLQDQDEYEYNKASKTTKRTSENAVNTGYGQNQQFVIPHAAGRVAPFNSQGPYDNSHNNQYY